MFPFCTIKNSGNATQADSVIFGERCNRFFVWSELSVNLSNMFHGKNIGVIIGSAVNLLLSFLDSVLVIILMGSKPKVVRIHTCLVVSTGTIMENAKSIWNRAFIQNPRGPVSKNGFPFVISPSPICLPISLEYEARPKPARISFVDFLPESLREIFGKSLRGQILRGKFRLHNQINVWFATLSAVRSARGHFHIVSQFMEVSSG